MGNIVLLDDLTINKIAAGEVIERPASVVKELVENSIDAGATNISIETRNGGISYIRITDNGKGFLPDDMEIAFERHATSKIRKAEDLETVKSMGFRGEALASIAAISRVELISKTEENSVGYKIVVEGGKILSKEEIGCPKGTTITVENLFLNGCYEDDVTRQKRRCIMVWRGFSIYFRKAMLHFWGVFRGNVTFFIEQTVQTTSKCNTNVTQK